MQQTIQLRHIAARSATAFLLAALCLYPLYIDKFSNLTEERKKWLAATTQLYNR